MNTSNRSLVTIDDLTNEEIENIFSLADDMSTHLNENLDICRGNVVEQDNVEVKSMIQRF